MNKKIIIILFIVLALTVATLIYFQAKAKPAAKTKTPLIDVTGNLSSGSQSSGTGSGSNSNNLNDDTDSNNVSFPLKMGSNGKAVKMIQAAVGVGITGTWDSATDFAVRNYNGSNQISYQDFADSITASGDQFPISNGSRGDAVTDVQILVEATPDGIFGNNTAAAVKAATGKKSIDSAYEYINLVNSVLGLNIGFKQPVSQTPEDYTMLSF